LEFCCSLEQKYPTGAEKKENLPAAGRDIELFKFRVSQPQQYRGKVIVIKNVFKKLFISEGQNKCPSLQKRRHFYLMNRVMCKF
jgi:hypothetical protein